MTKTRENGHLILAGNSIGHPDDIPRRSLIWLKQADLLVFEEDRGARQCLKAAGIFRDYLRYNEHDQRETLNEVRKALKRGKSVCYMSDQGMPTLADPGSSLLEIAYQLHCKLEIIPGPSSISAALAACPFPIHQYRYLGFLPRDEGQRQLTIEAMRHQSEPSVLLDTPYRRQTLLSSLAKVLGGDRQALCAVDISGPSEQYYLNSLDRLLELDLPKLNFVLVVAGKPQKPKARPNAPSSKPQKQSSARRQKKS